MEVKELTEQLRKLRIGVCEQCPFWVNKRCILRGSICLLDLYSMEDECTGLLQLEEYFEKHKDSTSCMDN